MWRGRQQDKLLRKSNFISLLSFYSSSLNNYDKLVFIHVLNIHICTEAESKISVMLQAIHRTLFSRYDAFLPKTKKKLYISNVYCFWIKRHLVKRVQ